MGTLPIGVFPAEEFKRREPSASGARVADKDSLKTCKVLDAYRNAAGLAEFLFGACVGKGKCRNE